MAKAVLHPRAMQATFTIDAANEGRRLETVLCDVLTDVPRSRLMKWLRTGKIRLNGGRTRPRALLAIDDVVRLPFDPDAQDTQLTPAEQAARKPAPPTLPPLDVVFEDDVLLIVNKPAHLASHPGMQHQEDSLTARIVQHLDAHHAPAGKRPGLAQRLDAGVTGLVPCGKTAAVLKTLSGPPHGKPLHKSYLALVTGVVVQDKGSITAPLLVTDAPMGNVPKVIVDQLQGVAAHTDYSVVRRFSDATLLDVTLRTGRTHQIRAHLRYLGHSILGDARYGDAARNAYLETSFGVKRPLLHAHTLRMHHPLDGSALTFAAPVPEDMARLMHAFAKS